MYDLDLFLINIDYVVKHNDEPEILLILKDGTRIEITCYTDFVNVYIGDNQNKFLSINDFVDHFEINGKSFRDCWLDVVHIEDDLDMIDFTKSPEEQFCVGGSSIRIYLE